MENQNQQRQIFPNYFYPQETVKPSLDGFRLAPLNNIITFYYL